MHLPFSLRDMQAAYMQSPHFCDIYNVIMFNRYPKHRKAVEKLQQAMLSQCVVQGGLLYIYMKNNFGEQETILCVPPSKIDIFLDQYHTSLLGGHSGITTVLSDSQTKNILSQFTLLCQAVHNMLSYMPIVQGKQKVWQTSNEMIP